MFFSFLIRFFLNGLPFHSQFILGLFVGTDLSFLASVYLSICGIFTYFFKFSDLIFLETVFSIHSLTVLGLDFCLVNKNSLIYTSGLVLLFFFCKMFIHIFS